MKKKLLLAALSVSLLAGTVTAAHADPRGKRFYQIDHTIATPANEQMAAAIAASLAIDPTGMSLISPLKCATVGDRSCASAHDLLVRILANDPHATVDGVQLATVDQLPDFYRKSVRMQKPPEGTYEMDCEVRSRTSPSGWEPKTKCTQRPYHFKTGELAYVDITTGRVIGAEDCANPVGGRVVQHPCAYIDHDGYGYDQAMHVLEYGTVNISEDQCTGLLRAGETEYEALDVERCPDPTCDFTIIDDALKQKRQLDGSYPLQPIGHYVIRVPLICAKDNDKCRIVLCKTLTNVGGVSEVMGVQTIDFKRSKKGTLTATILENAVEANGVKDIHGKQTTLYWHYPPGRGPELPQ